MKGLSVLITLALLVTAHLLAVHLRRARALPEQHRPERQMAANHAARTPAPPNAIYKL